MLTINPKWLLEKMGIEADNETMELIGVFWFRFQNAKDKSEFLKDALRKVTGR